jgi:hypothetical protein
MQKNRIRGQSVKEAVRAAVSEPEVGALEPNARV